MYNKMRLTHSENNSMATGLAKTCSDYKGSLNQTKKIEFREGWHAI